MRQSKMKNFALVLILCAAAGWAQDAPGADPSPATQQTQPADKRFSVTMKPTENGRYNISVENQGKLAIMAWAAEVTDNSSSSAAVVPLHIFFDTAANYPQDQPLQPGTAGSKPIPGRIGASSTGANVVMRAVIFADGSTAGDPAWIDKILARRRRMYIAINKVEEIVRDAVGREQRIDQIVSDVSRERMVARQQTEDADINAATDRVYSIATGLLSSTRKLNDATQAIWNIYEPWRGALHSSVPAQAMD
jgi:hypothetical protein